MARMLAIILGGGRGERLYPLTRERAKPAVPFGGKYRLVDIPISSCIHSGLKQIYVLTQFNSASLHTHIGHTYAFDSFTDGFVEILAAEQTFERTTWYAGTADAVRQNFIHFRTHNPDHYLILSGDQLYRMDFQQLFRHHLDTGADITVAVTPVSRDRVPHFGILQADPSGRIVRFVEKPKTDPEIDPLRMPAAMRARLSEQNRHKEYMASMGIYLFSAPILEQALDNEATDFGREIIPAAIERFTVQGYVFNGFWEDIGTIKSYYETNIALSSIEPDFDFYEEGRPIYTRRRDLPASKINSSTITQTLAADGCIITNASISMSIIGIRTIIESGAAVERTVCIGADYYESRDQKQRNRAAGIPDVGIGRETRIRGAIIDKNARIGEGCRIGVEQLARKDGDYGSHYIREGIIIIPKNAVVPSGAVI